MKYFWQISTALLIVLLFASMQTCSFHKGQSEDNTEALTDTIKYFTNRLGSKTASISTLQLENKQLQDLVIKKDAALAKLTKEFSKVTSIVKYKTITEFDTIRIAYKDTVPFFFERLGLIKEKWYRFSYRSNQKGLQIDSFNTWTNSTIITGFKKKWFLGKQTAVTDITNDNPFITVTGIKSAEVVVPEPWYKKWYLWLAAGITGGFLLAR